jgi:hypothetical protein
MPTPVIGGEEGFSLRRRIGRALGLGRRGKLREAVRDFRKPRKKARGRRGDLRRGMTETLGR